MDEQKGWTSSEPGTIKINVSSTCDQNCSNVRLGIIARDDSRRCAQAWAVAMDRVINLVVAEVNAARVALLMAQPNRWNWMEIQVDIKTLARNFQAKAIPVQKATIIIEDIDLL